MTIKSKILIIGDLAPPIQGISVVTDWVISTLTSAGCQVNVCNTTANRNSVYVLTRFHKFIKSGIRLFFSKEETIYIPLSHGKTLLLQSILVCLGLRKSRKVIVHHHTFLPIESPHSILFRICHGWLLRRANHIFLSTGMMKAYMSQWGLVQNSFVVTNHGAAVWHIELQEKDVRTNRKLKFVHSSNLTSSKGIYYVLTIFKEILNKFDNSVCILLGPTRDSNIKNAINKLINDYPARFFYISQYSPADLKNAMREASFFLFPSYYRNEASPLVVLEAQAMGLIAITSDIGCLKEDVIRPGISSPLSSWSEGAHRIFAEFCLSQDLLTTEHLKISRETLSLSNESELKLLQLLIER